MRLYCYILGTMLVYILTGCVTSTEQNAASIIGAAPAWMTKNVSETTNTKGQSLKYFSPGDIIVNDATYGLLYDFQNALSACPAGWRLPNNEDWAELLSNFGDDAGSYKDPDFWKSTLASNDSGFSARPAGYRNTAQADRFGDLAIFWSSTHNDEFAWAFVIDSKKAKVRLAEQHTEYAFSVRCIKN